MCLVSYTWQYQYGCLTCIPSEYSEAAPKIAQYMFVKNLVTMHAPM